MNLLLKSGHIALKTIISDLEYFSFKLECISKGQVTLIKKKEFQNYATF
jgi:hypothetical protein